MLTNRVFKHATVGKCKCYHVFYPIFPFDMLHDVLSTLSSNSERDLQYITMLPSLALNNFLEKLTCAVVIITLAGTLMESCCELTCSGFTNQKA